MSRQPSHFRFAEPSEDALSVLDMTGSVLHFVSDALISWDHNCMALEPKAMYGLTLVLEACRNDILTVADRLNAERMEHLEMLIPPPKRSRQGKG